MKKFLGEEDKLAKIISLGSEIAQFKDIGLVLEKILSLAREFVNAEAGSIYVRENNQLKFSQAQNDLWQNKPLSGTGHLSALFSLPVRRDSIAGYVASSGETLIIPDAYKLQGNGPYTFDRRYDELSGYRTRSVLAFPLRTHRGKINGVLQLINARDGKGKITCFRKADQPYITFFAASASVAIQHAQMSRDLVLRMVRMAEMRDPAETCAHADRVASYAVEIYQTWAGSRGLPQAEVEKNKDVLRIGAMLHDVGKIGIPDTILKKPGRLTAEEYEIMKRHTYLGAQLFPAVYSELDETASAIALGHHERWDGSGYPGPVDPASGKSLSGDGCCSGKRGEEIPPFARLVAIADVYDALCSRRSYKDSWAESQVLDILAAGSGREFDPEMIDASFSSLDAIHAIDRKYPRV